MPVNLRFSLLTFPGQHSSLELVAATGSTIKIQIKVLLSLGYCFVIEPGGGRGGGGRKPLKLPIEISMVCKSS